MPEPVIVPPAPTVTQPAAPGVDNSPGMEQVQRAFDRAYPDINPQKAQVEAPPAPPEAPKPPEPPKPPEQPAPPEKPPEDFKIPNFLEQALKGEEPAPPKPPEVDLEAEFPEELPKEERQSRIKGLRDAYKRLKGEVEELKKVPHRDPHEQQRLAWLEQNNKQMAEMLSRVGVEHSAQFQQEIIAPLTASWHEAARIVRDAGADPQELAKAMSLSGKAQFEALDMLFQEMPESAKMEAHDALRTYKRYEEARQRAIANAPKTLEAIRERETQRQYQELGKQRQGMAQMFDRALSMLRDEAKVEIFMKTEDPEGKWWNDQGEQIISQGRSLFLENTDMDKVAMACLLAPTADAYRKLFIKSQKQVGELQKIIKDRLGGEPTLSESGGNNNLMPGEQLQDDLRKPFDQVFLREFHKSQARAR